MLKKIKKMVGRLLGKEEVASVHKKSHIITERSAGRDKKNSPAQPKNNPENRDRQEGSSAHRQRHTKKPKSAGNVASRQEPKKAPKPEHPSELSEVPQEDGKVRFLDLPIHREVQFGIQQMGFSHCTPIQSLTLIPLLEGRDVAGKAQTGTGKTAAFLVAIFTKLLNNPRSEDVPSGTCRALVLAPTRELAIQIHKDAEAIGIFTGLKKAVVFGGMDHEKQRRNLAGPLDLVVGTPGRVIDYSRSGSLNLKNVEFLVIDEADRMLDMGFIPDVKKIVGQLPPKGVRQTLLFSATLDDKILRLCSGWLADPEIIESEPEKLVGELIDQQFLSVSRDEKLALTLNLISTHPDDRVLIFGNRKDINLRLQRDLALYGFNVPLLSGDISQERRIKILERFRRGEEKVLIATDVAARGIHVDDISLVINYDLPEQPEDYVHRIGRTGRAGRQGKAVSFHCEYGAYNLPAIEKLLDTEFASILPSEEAVKLPERVKNPVLPSQQRGAVKFSDRPRRRPQSSGRKRS